MKKLFILLLLFPLFVKSQTINIVSAYFDASKGKISVCADSTEHSGYECQINVKVDSILALPEYTEFINLCKSLSGFTNLASYICQNNTKYSMIPYKRILIKNIEEQKIFNIEQLTVEQQTIYNNFINKVKTLIIY